MGVPMFGQVIDALKVLGDTTSVEKVYDGPAVTAEYANEFVVVGGTEDPDDEPSSFDQVWSGLGAKTKNETGDVTCAVLVGTGGQDVKEARDRALAILGEFEAAVRADPTLGGVLSAGWCHVSGGRHVQRQNNQGLFVRITFTVSYQTKN